MANRHNVIQTPPREKRAQTLALQNLTDERLLSQNAQLMLAANQMVPIGKPQVVRLKTEEKFDDKTVKIETIEAKEESSSTGQFDEIIPEELFTS